MEVQDADRVDCSSKDLIQSAAKKLKFYTEVIRREDGFDLSPSGIPRTAFPKLLPRPMLQRALQDVSLKHHFTHAQVRCALARIQSSKFPSTDTTMSPRRKQVRNSFASTFCSTAFHHPMEFANDDYKTGLVRDLVLAASQASTGKTKPLRDGARILRRAPPPSIKNKELKRLVDASWKIIMDAEDGAHKLPRKNIELGNTKLQGLYQPKNLQKTFMATAHIPFVPPPLPSDPTPIKPSRRSKFIYDCHGRRQKAAEATKWIPALGEELNVLDQFVRSEKVDFMRITCDSIVYVLSSSNFEIVPY